MHANFQLSNSTGVGVECGDIRKDRHQAIFAPIPYTKILNTPFALLGRDKGLKFVKSTFSSNIIYFQYLPYSGRFFLLKSENTNSSVKE